MAKQFGPATADPGVPGPGSGVPRSSASAGITAGASASATGSEDFVPFVSQVPGTPVYFATFHGRGVSWFAVSLIMFAFLAGGLSLVFGPIWWLFWTAAGVAVIGALIAAATGIFDDWY